MKTNQWLPAAFLLCQTFGVVLGVTIHEDCAGENRDKVTRAAASVSKMAKYAALRAKDPDNSHRPGSILQDLLGAADANDQGVLNLVAEWMTKAGAAADSDNVTIHCDDKYLTTINANSAIYRDRTPGHNNIQVQAPRRKDEIATDNACGGVNEAFTYGLVPGSAVIVLCSDSPVGALNSMIEVEFESFRTKGNLKAVAGLKENGPTVGLDYFGRYLSYKVFHEMMHATEPIYQFPATLPEPDEDPVKGPVGEAYRYKGITGSEVASAPGADAISPKNRQHNADSFALLGCAWYLPNYKWNKGVCQLQKPTERPPLEYGSSPKMVMTRRRRRYHF